MLGHNLNCMGYRSEMPYGAWTELLAHQKSSGRWPTDRPISIDMGYLSKDLTIRVSEIPEFERLVVYYDQNENIYDFWIIVDEMDWETEDRIIDIECEFMRAFPNHLFDFMVIQRRGRDLDEILPRGEKEIFTR